MITGMATAMIWSLWSRKESISAAEISNEKVNAIRNILLAE
jgi:hypothetical protein